MSKQYTYKQIASDYELWSEYVDTDATMTEEEFNALSTEEKVEIQNDLFGQDESESSE